MMMAMIITANHVVISHHINHGNTTNIGAQQRVATKQIIVVNYVGYTIISLCDIKRKGIRMQRQCCSLIHHKEQTTHNGTKAML
jgi:hypothetical protein